MGRAGQTLTNYKLGVLSMLNWRPMRSNSSAVGNASHFERACREMEQMGLTARNLHDVWRIRPEGKAELEKRGRI